MKILLTLFVLFFSSSVFAESIIYNCVFKNNPNAQFPYPETILAIVDFNEQKLEKYFEDGENLTSEYECLRCSSDKNRVEINKKNYDAHSSTEINVKHARVFEIYSSDLVGHLWKQFQGGVNYQCSKY